MVDELLVRVMHVTATTFFTFNQNEYCLITKEQMEPKKMSKILYDQKLKAL